MLDRCDQHQHGGDEGDEFADRRAIAEWVKANAWPNQDVDAMKRAVGSLNTQIAGFDASCFDGVYVTGDITSEDIARLNESRVNGQEGEEDTSRLALPNPS